MAIELDKDLGVPIYSPVCVWCKHLHLDKERSCAAFPGAKAIPLTIWNGQNKHRASFPGDHGIHFEERPK